MEKVITVSGEAGEGIKTFGNLLVEAFFYHGYYVFAEESYHSRIRGGLDAVTIRASEKQVLCSKGAIDIFVPLNKSIILYHQNAIGKEATITDKTVVICDKAAGIILPNKIELPATETAAKLALGKMTANTYLFGYLCKMLGIPIETAKKSLEKSMTADLIKTNLPMLEEGFKQSAPQDHELPKRDLQGMINVSASESVGSAAIISGARFYSGYPMTPGSGIMNFMAKKGPEFGIVVEQAEDEIAAMNMAIGASFAGVRQMVSTSGGGFALMVEALSLAGATETPIVVVLAQRPAPATGFPTRTEQADLLFAINAGHGEFARYVIAPRTADDAFWMTIKAYEISSKHQVPVIILIDQFLADSTMTCAKWDINAVKLDRHLAKEGEFETPYKRHRFTESGVSPRLVPMQTKWPVITDSDEHDEEGHISEDLEMRKLMVEKRNKKLDGIKSELSGPFAFGNGNTLLVGWGSTFGPIFETVEQNAGKLRMLHFNEVWPLHTKTLMEEVKKAGKVVAVEGNFTGQFAKLLAQETGIKIDEHICTYWGRQMTPELITRELARKGVLA